MTLKYLKQNIYINFDEAIKMLTELKLPIKYNKLRKLKNLIHLFISDKYEFRYFSEASGRTNYMTEHTVIEVIIKDPRGIVVCNWLIG